MEGNGRRRVLIEAAYPQVDGGRHPAKRVVGRWALFRVRRKLRSERDFEYFL